MDEKQIREAFEQVAKQKNWNLAKGNCGWYVSAITHEAWQGWLACYQHLAQWQLIETAPKDGTTIVIARIEGRHCLRSLQRAL